MRKVLTFTLIFTGTVLTVFMFNLLMYAVVPDYHDAIASAVASSEDHIPVITPDMVKESTGAALNTAANTKAQMQAEYDAVIPVTTTLKDGDVPLSSSVSEAQKPTIIDKEYHEDCGTGKGYWVITYSDGSTAVE